MRGIKRAGIIIALALVSLGLLTGCGEKNAKRKIGKEARYYVANKYGFRPKSTDVELRDVGELEGVWHKKDAGTATMEYDGRIFKVYVSLIDPGIRYDDYHRQDVEEYLNDFFKSRLDCEDIHVWTTYGVPVCMVPGDVKAAQDVFTKCDNIKIYVSTYGLDRDTAKSLDVSGLGKDTEINIIDWTYEGCLEDEELMRETVVGLESDSYTDGYSRIGSYYRYSKGNLSSLEN
jgi:hypothetical protein